MQKCMPVPTKGFVEIYIELVLNKIKSIFWFKHQSQYPVHESVWNELFSRLLFSKVSIITLYLENKNSYRIYENTVSDEVR